MAASLTTRCVRHSFYAWNSQLKLPKAVFHRQFLSCVLSRKSSVYADLHSEVLEALIDLCQSRHFVTGGQITKDSLNGCNSYGPLGTELKRNLISQWWNSVVLSKEQVFGVETLHQLVEVTGQESAFTIVDNSVLDQIIKHEELSKEQLVMSLEKLLYTGGTLRKNLIQGALDQYVHSLNLVNRKLPFGLAQIGVCYQPETTTAEQEGDVTCRAREVTTASLVWFSAARTAGQWLDYWVRQRLLWWRKFAIGPSNFTSSDYQDDEGNKGATVYYSFPWGKEPIETLLNLGNKQLLQAHHENTAKLQGRDGRKSVIPHVVSINGNLDRGVIAYLHDSFQLEGSASLKRKMQQRKVLKLHPSLAPIKVALDMGRGPTLELRQVCQGLCQELLDREITVWPGHLETVQTSMEQLYVKYDEMGVIFTILISDSTLENGLVLLRNRDTTVKEMMHISEVKDFLTKYILAANNI